MAAPLLGSRRISSWPIIVGPAPVHLSLKRWFVRLVHALTQVEVHATAPVVRQRRSPDLQDDVVDAAFSLDPVACRRTSARPVAEDVLPLVGKHLDVVRLDESRVFGRRRIAEETRSQRVRSSAQPGSARKPVIPLDVSVPHRSGGFRRLHLQFLRRYVFSSANRRATRAADRASSTAASASPDTLDVSCARTRWASSATSSAWPAIS